MYFLQRMTPKIVAGRATSSSIDTASNAYMIFSNWHQKYVTARSSNTSQKESLAERIMFRNIASSISATTDDHTAPNGVARCSAPTHWRRFFGSILGAGHIRRDFRFSAAKRYAKAL
jgi:hypothetical protein